MKTKQFTFLVTVTVPEEATEADVKNYVSSEVRCGRGALMPPQDDGEWDPLYFLELVSVKNLARVKASPFKGTKVGMEKLDA